MPSINDYAEMERKKVEKSELVRNDNSFWKEIVLTFSTKKSLLSSKKIERFILFITFLTLTIIYIVIKLQVLTTIEFIELIGVWLAYGGYNTHVIKKENQNWTS